MREIRFRGKRLDNGEWVYGYLIGNDVIVGDIVEFNDEYFNTEFWYKVDPETVGQWTGLCDKNWNMIYERDIVKGHRWVNGKFQRLVGKVEYVAYKYVVTGIGKYLWNEQDDLNGSYEIIGNIYENPELLKGEENA